MVFRHARRERRSLGGEFTSARAACALTHPLLWSASLSPARMHTFMLDIVMSMHALDARRGRLTDTKIAVAISNLRV